VSTFDTVLASGGGTRLTVGGLLRSLHLQGRLEPLVREALTAEVVQDHARRAGLTVTDEEMQAAADATRRRQGLSAAAATRDWLAVRGLSVEDFEGHLEHGLLAAKVREQVTAGDVDGHFAARRRDFERLSLAVVVAPREDQAKELASQVRDEGRHLADVAGEQALPMERNDTLRKDLSAPLRDAVAAAEVGQLVGPVSTPRGFALVMVEELRPAELDGPTRQRIDDELFSAWLAAQTGQVTVRRPQTWEA
jgi:PPIC-type PPIASE domain